MRTIEPMSMGDAPFAMHLLSADMPPAQFVRELTQNAIEAILKLSKPSGKIVWGPWEIDGFRKLSIIDTGVGMSKDELKEFINKFFSSGGVQSLTQNFGIGGKVSALKRSPLGVTYETLKDGIGNTATLEFEFENGSPVAVGFSRVELPDGTSDSVRGLKPSDFPKSIADAGHGTRVILWGNSLADDTNRPPLNTDSMSARWLTKSINNTYWSFPPEVEVRAYEKEYASSPRPEGRILYGQQHFLNQKDALESKGSVHLSTNGANAIAHWWIYKKGAHSGYSDIANINGFVAARYQNELYEMATDKAKRNRLINFGLTLAKTEGFSRVTIIIEPQVSKSRISANAVRKSLILDNGPLPWDSWAEEFASKLPNELKRLIDESIDETTSDDLPCQERIKKYLHLFERNAYKTKRPKNIHIDKDPNKNDGEASAEPESGPAAPEMDDLDLDDDDTNRPHEPKNQSEPPETPRPPRPRPPKRPVEILNDMHNKSGKPNASLDSTPKIPEARWVSISNGTREPDQLEDFAAEYFRSQNLITINEDFRLFQSDFDFWCKELQVTGDSQKKLIIQVVKDKYQQVLLEAVMGVISLSNTSHWSNDKINEVLSQSTLTAVVTARSHVYDSIKRELYAKFRRKSDS